MVLTAPFTCCRCCGVVTWAGSRRIVPSGIVFSPVPYDQVACLVKNGFSFCKPGTRSSSSRSGDDNDDAMAAMDGDIVIITGSSTTNTIVIIIIMFHIERRSVGAVRRMIPVTTDVVVVVILMMMMMMMMMLGVLLYYIYIYIYICRFDGCVFVVCDVCTGTFRYVLGTDFQRFWIKNVSKLSSIL